MATETTPKAAGPYSLPTTTANPTLVTPETKIPTSVYFVGAFLLFPTLLAAGYAAGSRLREGRWWVSVAYAGGFFAIVFTYTRASAISLIIGLIFFLSLVRTRYVMLVTIGLIVSALLFTPTLSRFTGESHNRLTLTRQGLETAIDHAGTGVGLGTYEEVVDVGLRTEEGELDTTTPHNSFILAAAETGLPGSILLLIAAAAPGVALLRPTWRRREPLVVASTAGLLAFGIHNISNNLFFVPSIAVYYWLVAASAMGVAGIVKRSEGKTAHSVG